MSGQTLHILNPHPKQIPALTLLTLPLLLVIRQLVVKAHRRDDQVAQIGAGKSRAGDAGRGEGVLCEEGAGGGVAAHGGGTEYGGEDGTVCGDSQTVRFS